MKEGLVITSFGTSVPEAGAGIAAVEKVLKETAPHAVAVRAYTSPTIRRILAGRGQNVFSLNEALEYLTQTDVERVVVQPTHLLYGYEYEKLKAEAERFAGRFETVTVGRPLLANNDDLMWFAKKIAETNPQRDGAGVVYMGHGTGHFANAVYPALQTALHLIGRDDIYIGTVEGWPGLEDILKQLKTPCQIRLLPLMLVAGEHAKNDMAGEWKSSLEQAGHSVQCEFTGLGELEWIQERYGKKLREVLEFGMEAGK